MCVCVVIYIIIPHPPHNHLQVELITWNPLTLSLYFSLTIVHWHPFLVSGHPDGIRCLSRFLLGSNDKILIADSLTGQVT